MICPLCGSDHMNVAATEIREGAGNVYRCEPCDFEMLDSASVNYDGDYRKTHGPTLGQEATPEDIFNAYKDHQEVRRNQLLPFVHRGVRLLEVGCSAGHFLNTIKHDVGEAVGCDLDRRALEYAGKRVNVETYGSLPNVPNLWFDIVCAYQTLEHVPDLFGFVAELKAKMKPGGLLVIEVPSINDPLLTLYDSKAYRRFFYHEAHRWYFSPTSLGLLMEKCGFEGQIEGVQDYNFINHLHWHFKGRPQPTCKDGLSRARLPIAQATLPHYDLEMWADEADLKYKDLLKQHGLTENITFIGRVK